MNKITSYFFLILSLFIISKSLFPQELNPKTDDFQSDLIDSLIKLKTLNDKTILISFAPDVVTAIKTQKGIVVIDAGISKTLTSGYRKKIENYIQSGDFVYVINTHCHSDHIGGNSVFREAKIIRQENGIKDIFARQAHPDALLKIIKGYELKLEEYEPNTKEWNEAFIQKQRYACALEDIGSKISEQQPVITFSDKYHLDMGDVSFELKYFGNCHSNSDILIFVPELKILFTGDLLFKFGRPSMDHSLVMDKSKWKQATLWLKERMPDIETIISGHGEFLSKEDIQYFIDTIRELCSN